MSLLKKEQTNNNLYENSFFYNRSQINITRLSPIIDRAAVPCYPAHLGNGKALRVGVKRTGTMTLLSPLTCRKTYSHNSMECHFYVDKSFAIC